MKRGARIALFSLGGVVATGIVLTTAFLLYLRTESGSNFILSQMKSLAKKYANAELTYKEGRIDPFSRIHFKDLSVVQIDGQNKTDLKVKAIDVVFGFSVLSRRVDFEEITIDRPTLVARMVATKPAEKTESPPPSNLEAQLEQARNWITSPKAKITIKKFSLTGLNIDVDYEDAASHLKAKLQELGLAFTLRLLPSDVAFAGDFKLDESSVWMLMKAPDSAMEVSLSPRGTAKWSGTIRQDGKWIYEIQPSEAHFVTRRVTAMTAAKGAETRASISDLRLNANGKLLAKTVGLFVPDPHSFESVSATNGITSSVILVDHIAKGTKTFERIDSTEVNSNAILADDLSVTSKLLLRKIFAPAALKKPVDAHGNFAARVTRDLKDTKGTADFNLAGIPLLEAAFTGKKDEKKLDIVANGKAAIDPRLGSILKSGESINKVGTLVAKFDLGAEVGETQKAVVKMDVRQNKKGTMVAFEPLLMNATVDRNAEKIAFKTDLQTKSLSAQKINVRELAMAADGVYEKNAVDANGLVKIRNRDTMKFHAKASMGEESLSATASLEAHIADHLEGILTRQQLNQSGNWDIKSDLKVEQAKQDLKIDGATVLTQVRKPDLGAYGVSIDKPIVINHKLDLNKGKLHAQVDSDVPLVDLQKMAKINDTRFIASIKSPNYTTAKDIDVDIEIKQGKILLAKEVSKDAPPLNGLNLTAKASVRNENRFNLDKFSAEFNNLMMIVSAEASGHMKRKDFQMQGMATMTVPKDFPSISGQKFAGKIDFPWTLSVFHGRDLNFEGNMEMQNLAWSKGPQSVRGISGKVPVSEKLVLQGASVKFASLIQQNPFERVDYERLRPLIFNAEQVRIQEIGFEEKTYGPFVGFFSMRQNMIFAHQFDFSMGTHGLARGELYFDVYPANLQMGFLSRLTALDLGEVLPKKFLPKMPKGDRNVSGRSGIVVNLNRGSVDGRVDITEIGGSQLITLINVLDPKYEDDKMNLARSALGVGYPTFVQMSFQKGYLDMGMDIAVLGVTKRFDVRGIPISTLVSSATADIVKKTKEGPLK